MFQRRFFNGFTRAIVKSKAGIGLTRYLSTANASPLYELRCYNIYPKDFKNFIELTNEWISLRTKHSILHGYWTSEIGGINDVVHIWEYESLTERANVRKKLSQDSEWLKNYFSIILPMISRQDNALMTLAPNSTFNTNVSKGGVYELQVLQGSRDETINSTNLLGRFRGIIGPLNTEYRLLQYASIDDVAEAHRNSQDTCNSGSSRLLQPCSFSPLG